MLSRNVRIFIFIFIIQFETLTALAKGSITETLPVNVGSLSAAVNQTLKNWQDPSKVQPIVAKIFVDNAYWRISILAYDSRVLKYDGPKNNCVAAPFDKLIQCDLKIIDDLIAEFRLMEYGGLSQNAAQRRKTREFYRKQLITWILAHEIGHVVLRHGISDFEDPKDSFAVFDPVKQREELAADGFAVRMVGSLDSAAIGAYSAVTSIVNSLIDKSVCPASWPSACDAMPAGVGLIYDYTSRSGPIRVSLGGTHPAFVARFLRIIYLGGTGTERNDINYESRAIMDQLQVETSSGSWSDMKDAFK